jgi:hypothetical protein
MYVCVYPSFLPSVPSIFFPPSFLSFKEGRKEGRKLKEGNRRKETEGRKEGRKKKKGRKYTHTHIPCTRTYKHTHTHLYI